MQSLDTLPVPVASFFGIYVSARLAFKYGVDREYINFRRKQLVVECEKFSEAALGMTKTLNLLCHVANAIQQEEQSEELVLVSRAYKDACIHGILTPDEPNQCLRTISRSQGAVALMGMRDIAEEMQRLAEIFESKIRDEKASKVDEKIFEAAREQIFQARIRIIDLMSEHFKIKNSPASATRSYPRS